MPRTPVLLACDDETIRTVAERLGFDFADPSMQFGRDVSLAFQVGPTSGWKSVVTGAWGTAARPRPLPAFFPVLCLWVLAATRMAPDEKHPTMEYHGRLCQLAGVPGDDSLECFNFIGLRFQDLAEWLEQDMQGRHGHLIVPDEPASGARRLRRRADGLPAARPAGALCVLHGAAARLALTASTRCGGCNAGQVAAS